MIGTAFVTHMMKISYKNYKVMFGVEKIFREIFGGIDWDDIADTFKQETESDGEYDKTYYRSTFDRYDKGKHVSHKEKVVKDGKVVKDVDEKYIEDKSCNDMKGKCECKENCKKDAVEEKDELIKKLNETLSDNENLINEQNRTLLALKDENRILKEKLDKIKGIF